MRLSFVTANFVARELGYKMTEGWGQGDSATQAAFRPLETFGERFEEMIEEIAELGFDTVDLWLAHLHPEWATKNHVSQAKMILVKQGLRVWSLAGGFGETLEALEKSCRLAQALGAKVLAGSSAAALTEEGRAMLARYGLKFGLENHPEKSPAEVLEKIGTESDSVGTAIDTGWWATQGFDAAQAIRELGPRIVAVHLKDIKGIGSHVSVQLGRGIVPIDDCLAALKEVGYKGLITVEHEPEKYDPREEIEASVAFLESRR